MSSEFVYLELTRSEALVLFEWVSRYNDAKDVQFEDQAEQRVLWDIETMLESKLVEPFEPGYHEIIARARAIVRDTDK